MAKNNKPVQFISTCNLARKEKTERCFITRVHSFKEMTGCQKTRSAGARHEALATQCAPAELVFGTGTSCTNITLGYRFNCRF